MLRKVLVLVLCLLATVHLFSGCSGASNLAASTGSEKKGMQETAPEQPTDPSDPVEPDDGSFKMYYDDHTPITAPGGTTQSGVEISNQEITSFVVGTDAYNSVLRDHLVNLFAGKTGSLLDVCCGEGFYTNALGHPGLDVFGLDIFKERVRLAAKWGGCIYFVANMAVIPF